MGQQSEGIDYKEVMAIKIVINTRNYLHAHSHI